jgi:hypothetical protein
MKQHFLLLTALLFSFVAFSQQTKETVVKPYVLAQTAIIIGESEPQEQYLLSGGIRKRTWLLGAGIGVDDYHTRSVPVFVDVRKQLHARINTPFAFANAGYHFLWEKDERKDFFELDSEGGLYYDLGIGYQIGLTKKLKLLLSGSYTGKHFSKTKNVQPWVSTGPTPESIRTYEYRLSRATLKLGLAF